MDKKKARIALRKSIKHWCIDIRRPFLNGDNVDPVDVCWKKKRVRVRMYSSDCELCKVYYCKGCLRCPLDVACEYDNSPYMSFYKNMCLRTANVMIQSLVRCYCDVI